MEELIRDGLRHFLDAVRLQNLATGHLRALLVIAVGGRIESEGQLLSKGSNWRELADLLKKLRWDKLQVAELGIDVKDLPPRDRSKYWYSALAKAGLDSAESARLAMRLIPELEKLGYKITLPRSS